MGSVTMKTGGGYPPRLEGHEEEVLAVAHGPTLGFEPRHHWIEIKMPFATFWLAENVFGPNAQPDPHGRDIHGGDDYYGSSPSQFLAILQQGLPSRRNANQFRHIAPRSCNLFDYYPGGEWEKKAIQAARREIFNAVAAEHPKAVGIITYRAAGNETLPEFFNCCAEAGHDPYQEIEYGLMAGVGLAKDWSDYQLQLAEGSIPSL